MVYRLEFYADADSADPGLFRIVDREDLLIPRVGEIVRFDTATLRILTVVYMFDRTEEFPDGSKATIIRFMCEAYPR